MICSKCGVQNDNSASYCEKCGAPLSVYDFGGGGSGDLTDSSKSLLAIKEAKRLDVSNMRPITRMAYKMETGSNGSIASMLVSLVFFGSCMGIVATLIAVFDTVNKISQTVTSMGVEGGLSTLYKQDSSNTTNLVWLTAMLVGLIILFVVTGKLVIRTRKLRRRLGKNAMDNF